MSIKNRQCSGLLTIIAAILVQPGAAFASQPPANVFEITVDPVFVQVSEQSIQNSTEVEVVGLGDTDYLSDKYTLLSNEFHRMLEEDGKLNEGRLLLLLNSSRDFEQKSVRLKKAYWIRQFKVLNNSIGCALEVARNEEKK